MYIYTDPQELAGASGETKEQKEEYLLQAKRKQTVDAEQRAYKHLRKTQMLNEDSNPFVEKTLEGATVKFGTGGEWTLDTGIPFDNKYLLAATIGIGDQMGDAWRGIRQALQQGSATQSLIDEQAQNDNEEILRHLYGDKVYGNMSMGGAVVGALAEPVGLLLPLTKAKNLSTAVASAMGIGGLYGATFYVDGNESRLKNAAITSMLMGAGGGIANKYMRHAVGDEMADRLSAIKSAEAKEIVGPLPNAKASDFAKRYSKEGLELDETGTPVDWFAQQVGDLGKKKKKKPKRAKVPKPKKTAQDVVEGLEARSAMEGARHATVNQYRSLVDSVIQPLVDNVGRYSKIVAAKLRNADGIQHVRQHQWSSAAKPWQDWVTGTLNVAQRTTLKKLLNNGGFNKATMTFIQQTGGSSAVGNAKAVQRVLDEILGRYKDVGYKIDGRPGYFPRAVSDLRGLRKREQGVLDNLYAKAQAKRGGRALTPNEKAHIDEHYFTFDQRYSNTSGSLKGRVKKAVTDEELGFYHNPEDALHFYIHTAAEDIAKREFFKGFGHKPKKDGLNPTGTDIDDSITSLVDTLKRDLSPEETTEMVRLLRSRFSADVHKTHKSVQALKNLSYAGTLGNFWSAMTQFGDLVFAFHKYGIRSTLSALLGPKVSNRTELGIEKAMAELNSETKGITSKIADFAFKWSGFDKVDRFGKNININASLRSNQKMARRSPQKFMEKWEPHFGDETQALANEIAGMKLVKNAEMSDNAKLMLWNDLADTQPIGLSEMPEKYLNMPNGRIFYAYKTFSLKQFNYLRSNWAKEKNPFKKGYNLAMFATMFTLANSGIDGLKDFMSGKDFDFEDKMWDNLVSMVGTSKYAVDKSQGLGGIILQALQPVPIVQAGKALDVATGSSFDWGDKGDSLATKIPVAGKVYKEWFQ